MIIDEIIELINTFHTNSGKRPVIITMNKNHKAELDKLVRDSYNNYTYVVRHAWKPKAVGGLDIEIKNVSEMSVR
jgi:hypothetical protein